MTTPAARDLVIVIDDDQAVLDSFKSLLEAAGYPTRVYDSAPAYLEDGAPPGCLILDQHMPHMTGVELAEWLRTRGEQTPILLITAAPTPALEARAAKCGIECVLAKPPSEMEVINFVRECMSSRS